MGLESAIGVPELLPSPCVWVPSTASRTSHYLHESLGKTRVCAEGRASFLSWGEAGLGTSTGQGRDGSTALNVQGVNKCGLLHVFAKTDNQLEEAEI